MFAETAAGFDDITPQRDIGECAAEVVFIVFNVGIAGERYAGERALAELHFAVEQLLADGTGQQNIAVYITFGQGGVQFGGVEIFAGYVEVQRLVFKQL